MPILQGVLPHSMGQRCANNYFTRSAIRGELLTSFNNIGHEEQFPLQASAHADGLESGPLRLTITRAPAVSPCLSSGGSRY